LPQAIKGGLKIMRLSDVPFLKDALKLLSGITGLNFSLYDDQENVLIPPSEEDPILGRIKKTERGQKLYNDFLSKYLKQTLKGTNSLIVQSFTMQYQVFIPIYRKDVKLIALSDGFYMSREDFDRFNERKEQFGVGGWPAEDRLDELKFIDSRTIENYINSIKPLFENIILYGHEKDELNKKRQWSRTIISLVTNLKPDSTIEDIGKIMIDTVIFLFDVDTAALFYIRNGYLHPESVFGRSGEIVRKLRLSRDNNLIAGSLASRTPVSATDRYKLNFSGLPAEISSVYLFPISSQIGFFGFLGIFNSILDDEVFEAVNEICKLWTYLFGVRYIGDKYRKCHSGMDLISKKTLQLFSHYKDQQTLCDEIVNESAALVGAEKCSLMMPDETDDVLRVVSTKGVNKWLMKDVKLRTGEGIAGKVFELGEPILIDSREKLKTFLPSSRPLFKTQSCMSIPLKIADETIGTLNLSDKASGKPFNKGDLAAIAPLAMQATLLLKLNGYHKGIEEKTIEDPLTGLYSRRFFGTVLGKEYQRANRSKLHFSVALLSIDNFKALTDARGPEVGNYVLSEIAGIMAGSARANDFLFRLEGDEFAIIMPQTGKEEAFRLLERIRTNVSAMPAPDLEKIKSNVRLIPLRGAVENITVSAGVATFPECGESLDDVLMQAGKALYSAKSRGKNQTVSWDSATEFKMSQDKENTP
jgi:diguanylate cyclase (GGDEF)-like protein